MEHFMYIDQDRTQPTLSFNHFHRADQWNSVLNLFIARITDDCIGTFLALHNHIVFTYRFKMISGGIEVNSLAYNYKQTLTTIPKRSNYRRERNETKSSLSDMFRKNHVLKNFAKFTGKHLRQSLFSIKLPAWGVFLWILQNF